MNNKWLTCVIILVLVVLGMMISRRGVAEGFSDEIEENLVRYGDTICLWTWTNSFVRLNSNGRVDTSARLNRPEDIPRSGWIWEYFIIEDPRETKYGYNNNNPVKYGDAIALRCVSKPAYMAISNDVGVTRTPGFGQVKANNIPLVSTGEKTALTNFTLITADVNAVQGVAVKYGDNIYLRTVRNTFVKVSDPPLVSHGDNQDEKSLFTIVDRYGQGNQIDWARRGTSTQSSTYGNYLPNNAIDGNITSFNSTQNQVTPWWQVSLPRDVHITTVKIGNRRDCCQDRLKDFDIIIYDAQNKRVGIKNFAIAGPGVTWDNVGLVGRTVRIQLRGRGMLHMSEVNVYGKSANTGALADKSLSADIVSESSIYTQGQNNQTVVGASDLPYSKQSKSLSVAMMIKLTSLPKTEALIFHRGRNDRERMPAITLGSNGLLRVHYDLARKSGNVYEIPTPLPLNTWQHLVVLFDGGINRQNGWITGAFPSKIVQTPGAQCCYYINPKSRQYYYLSPESSQGDVKSNVLEPAVITGFKYMGIIDQSKINPSLQIYLNGQLRHKIQLPDVVNPGFGSITVGASPNMSLPSADFVADMVRYYNYAISPAQISKLAILPVTNAVKTLIKDSYVASRPVSFESNQIPYIDGDFTISFWLKYKPKSAVITVVDKAMSPSILLDSMTGNIQSSIKTRNQAYPRGEGITGNQARVVSGDWNHVALTQKGRLVTIYVNGQQSDQATLSDDPIYNGNPILIGGPDLNGEVADFKVANYAMTGSEIGVLLGNHPDSQYNEIIRKVWREMGCLNDPIPRDQPNRYADWRELVKKGEITSVEAAIRDLKNRADQGDKKAMDQCYGGFTAGMLKTLSEKSQIVKYVRNRQNYGMKCLPIAPYTCPKVVVPSGQASVPSGQASVPSSQASVPSGQASVPSGQASVPSGQASTGTMGPGSRPTQQPMRIEDHPDYNRFAQLMRQQGASEAAISRYWRQLEN